MQFGSVLLFNNRNTAPRMMRLQPVSLHFTFQSKQPGDHQQSSMRRTWTLLSHMMKDIRIATGMEGWVSTLVHERDEKKQEEAYDKAWGIQSVRMMSDSWEGGCCPMFPWCYVRWYSHGVVSVICPVMFPWWADDQHRVATPRLHIRWAKPRWVIRTVMSGDKQMRMFCNITLTCWCPGAIIMWCSVAFPQWQRRWPIHCSAQQPVVAMNGGDGGEGWRAACGHPPPLSTFRDTAAPPPHRPALQ